MDTDAAGKSSWRADRRRVEIDDTIALMEDNLYFCWDTSSTSVYPFEVILQICYVTSLECSECSMCATLLGDGVWVDICWLVWNGSQGSATFVMSNGIAGANVFQQTRQSGQPPTPQTSGSNQLTLGGRIRFVGKTTMVGGSSSVSGSPTAVSATIRYRLQPLR